MWIMPSRNAAAKSTFFQSFNHKRSAKQWRTFACDHNNGQLHFSLSWPRSCPVFNEILLFMCLGGDRTDSHYVTSLQLPVFLSFFSLRWIDQWIKSGSCWFITLNMSGYVDMRKVTCDLADLAPGGPFILFCAFLVVNSLLSSFKLKTDADVFLGRNTLTDFSQGWKSSCSK